MLLKHLNKCFHNSAYFWNVSKSDLAKLRKRTGYTFTNCKKALEINKNIEEAEKWLKEQALALGWAKANKLEGRATSQGLVGVTAKDNCAVMLEVNCETDFVANNKKFRLFVEQTVNSCFLEAFKIKSGSEIQKVAVSNEDLKCLPGTEGKSLSDLCALTISELGENVKLRRAIYVNCPEDMQLSAYAHFDPLGGSSGIYAGKYGAIVAYSSDSYDNQRQRIAQQLCQHVIGMNPKQVGIIDQDEPNSVKDDESMMIHQEFLLDPELTVNEFIDSVGINIIDFVRFECGEHLEVAEGSESIKATA